MSATTAMTTTTAGANTEQNNAKANKSKLKIACCSMPFSGHLNPMMSLAEGLRQNKNNDVCIVTLHYGAKKIKSKCEELGVQIVELTVEGLDSDDATLAATKGNIIFPFVADQIKSLLDEALSSYKPDVIVSDFGCLASQEYARSNNIPLVINWPGPFSLLRTLMRPMINMEDNRYIAIGGLFVSWVKCNQINCLIFGNILNLGTFADRVRNNVNSGLVIVNSFWGLEAPCLLHPNIVPVGPIMKPLPKDPDFSMSHPELHDFLTKARGEGNKILLVTTGSLVQLEQWLVVLLFRAFSQLESCSIVWSLKEPQQEFIPDIANPKFHFSSWLPQPMLLASNLVDGVLTHCGWGGTLECIAGGKPVVALPFFADQMKNAQLLLDAGCATTVGPMPAFNLDLTGRSSYTPNKSLNAETVTEGCQRLLADPKYLEAAKRLQALATTAPGMGCAAACSRIEHAARHGIQHLCSDIGSDSDTTKNRSVAHRLTGHRPFLFTFAFFTAAVAAAALALRPKVSKS